MRASPAFEVPVSRVMALSFADGARCRASRIVIVQGRSLQNYLFLSILSRYSASEECWPSVYLHETDH